MSAEGSRSWQDHLVRAPLWRPGFLTVRGYDTARAETHTMKEGSIPSSGPSTRIVLGTNQARDDGEESRNVWGFTDTRYQIAEDGQVEITGTRYSSSGQKLPSLLPWIAGLMEVDIPTEQRALC